MPDLTKKQLREIDEMNAILAGTQVQDRPVSNSDFEAEIESDMDSDNIQASINALNPEDTPTQEEEIEEEQEEVEVPKMLDVEKYEREAKAALEEEANPIQSLQAEEKKDDLDKQIEEQNKQNKIAAYSELERLAYDTLDEISFDTKEKLLKTIQDIEANEDNFDTKMYMAKTSDGFQPKMRRTMTPEAAARIKQAREEYQEIIRPVNEKYLGIINNRIENLDVEGQTEKFAEDQRAGNPWSPEQIMALKDAGVAERFLNKAKRRVEDNLSGAGAWGAMLSEAQDPDFYTMGIQGTSDAVRLLSIVIKDQFGAPPTEAESQILSAINTHNDALNQIDTKESHTVLSNVMQTIPWMAQMAASGGVGKTVETGAKNLLYKSVLKNTGKILKQGVKPAAMQAIKRGGVEAAAYTAGVLAQSAIMPSTLKDAAERYTGEFQVERDLDGNFVKAYIRDDLYDKVKAENEANIKLIEDSPLSRDENGELTPEAQASIATLNELTENTSPVGPLEASYKAVTNTALELFTERIVGGQITKFIKKTGFKDPLSYLPKSKMSPYIESLKKTFGYQGLIPEMLEEEAMIPLNAMLVGDSQYSDLWDGHQQRELFLQVATTGALMGVFGGVVSLPSRVLNRDFYKERRKMLRHIEDLKQSNPSDIGNLIDLSSSATEVSSLVSMQEKLRDEGKNKEADLVSEKIMFNQMMHAFDTHTIDEFEDALQTLGSHGNLPENVRNNIAKAQTDITAMKEVYDRYSKKKNISTIMRLQANKMMSKQAEMELEQQAAKIASEDMVEDVTAYAEKHKIHIPEGISLENLYDNAYESTLDAEDLTALNTLKDKLEGAEIASLGAFQRVQMAKNEAKLFHKDSRVLFNEQTSALFEKKVAAEEAFNKAMYKNNALFKAEKAGDAEAYEAAWAKLVEGHKDILSDEKIAEIKARRDKEIAEFKEFNQRRKEKEILAKAEALRKKQEEEGKLNPEVKEVEATIDNMRADAKAEKEEKISNEQLQLNEEFKAQADSLKFAFTPTDPAPKEPAEYTDDIGFELPRVLSENLSDEHKTLFKDKVKGMFDILKRELGHAPSFKDLVTKFANEQTYQQAEEYYNVLALGWNLNGYKKVDFGEAYDKIFDPFKTLAAALAQDDTIFADHTAKTLTDEVIADTHKRNKKVAAPVTHTPEGVPVGLTKADGLKTITSQLKLGFLAMDFGEQDGKRQTVGDDLHEGGLVDFKRLLDPDKFNAGSTLNVGIPDDNVLAKTTVYTINDKGAITKVPYNTWLEEGLQKDPNFLESEEYMTTVPMFAYDTDGTPVAYIHSIGWYNTDNIGRAEDPPTQAKIIQDARKEVSEFRKEVISGNISSLEIHSKKGMIYHNISETTPALTINEANPNSIIGVSGDRGNIKQGLKFFENKDRVIINTENLKAGITYDLRRIGTNEKGQETWYAFNVLKQDDQKENKLSEANLNTVRWALAAHFKKSDYVSYLKPSEEKDPVLTGITKDKAEEIVARVLEETGYDLSSREDTREFLRLYIPVKDFSYFSLSKSLFNPNLAEARKEFKNHVATEGLQTDAKMVEIDGEGILTATNKTYSEHLKDYFKTTVKSFNVGTAENPVWATNIQPSINFGYATKPVEQVIAEQEELAAKEKEEVIESKETAADKANQILDDLGLFPTDTSFDLPLTIEDTSALEGVFKNTEGVSIKQEGDITDFLFNNISTMVDIAGGSSISKEDMLSTLRERYTEIVRSNRDRLRDALKAVEAQYAAGDTSPKVVDTIRRLEDALTVFTNISKNWNNIEEKALAKVKKYTKITDDSFQDDMSISLREKNYSKSSLEEDSKNKTSYRLRRFFAGVSDRTPNGATRKGFLGLPTYVGFTEVYDGIAQILSSPIETESDFDTMMLKLNEAETSYKWLPDVIQKLEGASEQIKKEFVYNYTKHALSMKFAMYSTTSSGGYSLKIYDTNSSEISRTIRKTWSNNFKMTPLVGTTEEGGYKIDKTQAANLAEQFKGWDETPPSAKQARLWLRQFGIVVSEDAMEELVNRGMWNNGQFIEYKYLFQSKDGIFRLLNDYLTDSTKGIINKKDTSFDEVGDVNHPYTNINNVLKNLATIEGRYTNQSMTLSFRDNGKSIFGLTPNKYATDRVLQLKQFDADGENELVEQLRKLSISKESYLLDLLEGEEAFRGKFGIDHIGITSLKERGSNTSPFSGITDLSEIDHDLTKMAGLQDTKQGQVQSRVDSQGNIVLGGNGISMRMGRMFLPTMSDKSQMLLLNTGVFNFFKDKNKSFEIASTGEVGFTPALKNLLFNQLVKPELNRISKFHKTVGKTNVTGYNLGAQIFHFIPALNNIKDESGLRMIELMAKEPNTFTAEVIEEEFKIQIDAVLQEIIAKKVADKKALWEDNVVRDTENKITKIKFFDKDYLNQLNAPLDQKFEVAIYDFVLNSFLANSNMYTMLAGDPAVYSQDKLFKNFNIDNLEVLRIATIYGKEHLFEAYPNYNAFTKALTQLELDENISEKLAEEMRNNIKPIPTTGSDSDYLNISKNIGVNLGKRLALLIAPGSKLANSKNKKYKQIFLKDSAHIAENMEYLVSLFHGEEALAEVQDLFDEYRETDRQIVKDSIRKKLGDKFSDLEPYFDIESTDAQEYSTVAEHINILEQQGRIPDMKLKEIREALDKGRDLTPSLMQFVLQPIKPVYTGQILDEAQDVTRTVYIKSSSFPLLPQLTKGRGLDALRVKMEEMEAETRGEEPVRASYQTANKVGSMTNPIDPFDAESLATAGESTLTLDRDNFRIQQDVPFKSDKNKEDKVSMGTQIFKLLFGDGMLDLKEFKYKGETVDGRKLYEEFNKTFSEIIRLKKKNLYRELGLDKDGLPIDEKKSVERLQKILQEEAIDKGYPRQDIEGLTFTEERDVNNEVYYDFKLPLWLSANSNKYEALLNSIITNRLIAQKMPGSSYVLGSEEGMKMTEDATDIEGSRVIHVGEYEGGELKGVQNQDGRFTYAEVLVPSKFRNAKGELIDLYEQKAGKYTYIEKTSKGFKLKDDMIEEELLTSFSFRTPTSSHVSASIIKIAGIIPPESGDLMVVPKNFVVQKGLDFDVDKETAYNLWSVKGKDSKIEAINEGHKEAALERAKRKPEDLRNRESSVNNLFTAIFGDEFTSLMDDAALSEEQRLEHIEDKFNLKLFENDFIRIHKAVYENPNPEVQKKINKALSMQFASDQADFIEGLNSSQVDNSDFTILDDAYQKSKMELGAAGKLAIGVYSNYVTFHSLSQQLDSGNSIQLMDLETMPATPKTFRIGNLVSDGTIGRANALTSSDKEIGRSISEVFAEKQNTATDNEKEQILGRVNINGETINVDALMTLLGFDKADKVNGQETSVPYLFLSQPILKDYVKAMKKTKEITSDFVANAEEQVIRELKGKYVEGYTPDPTVDPESETLRLQELMTGKGLIDEISGKREPGLQLAVLDQFLELKAYADSLSRAQSVINTTNLGKSIIESNDLLDKLEGLADNKRFRNVSRLVGDYISAEDWVGPAPEGYVSVGDYYIKATTPQGQIVVNGIYTGNRLWNQYFPYSTSDIRKVMKEVLDITNSKEKSDKTKIELQYEVFKEIKRYLNSNTHNGLFSSPAGVEREGLFIDSKDNISLANYMNELNNTPVKNQKVSNQKGAASVKDNKLIKQFQYVLNTNGEPSTVFFNNAASENFEEDELYNSMAELVLNPSALPDKNGQPYDTKKMVADLVAYAYAEGGVQEVVQFVKYVPLEYLESMGFTRRMQTYSPKNGQNAFTRALGITQLTDETAHQTYTFVKQYMQHYPEKAPRITNRMRDREFTSKVHNKDNKKQLDAFVYNTEEDLPKFLARTESTKSKRKQDKMSLYQHIGDGKYQRISILGAHGMNEYEMSNKNMHSLLDKADPVVIKETKSRKRSKEFSETYDIFDIEGGNAQAILEKIKNYRSADYKHFSKLAEFLLPTVKAGLVIKVADTAAGNENKASGRTSIDKETGNPIITIDSDVMNSNDHTLIARTFMHEFVHSVTGVELLKYFNIDGTRKSSEGLPLHVERLNAVFNEAKKKLGPKLDALVKKRADQKAGKLPADTAYNKRELEVLYGGVNIFEFVAVAMTEPEFQRELGQTTYKATKHSLLHRFKVAVMNILGVNSIPIKEDSITFEALNRIMDFIEIEAEITSDKNFMKKIYQPNRYTTKEWREAQEIAKDGGITDAETEGLDEAILGNLDMPRTAESVSKIDEIFNNNVALQKIGSKEDYSKFLALTGGEYRVDVKGFENYKLGLTEQVLDSLPDICN